MEKNWKYALKQVGLSEGGFTKHKLDRGNWTRGRLVGTNHGISAPVLRAWLGYTPTMTQMRALTKVTAAKIFKVKFWDTVRADDLPSGVDYAVFDFSVNSGPRRATKALQRTVNVKPDGIIGKLTMAGVNKRHPRKLIATYMARRLSFLQRLRGKNGWQTFGRGWGRRVKRVLRDSLKMVE